MILWPDVLPQTLLLEGYSSQLADVLARTAMDAGPAKVRRRFTAGPKPVSGSVIVTPAQLVFFQFWYETVLLNGALRFGWFDPFGAKELTNLLTNGGFDSATTGWIAYQCSLASIVGGIYGNCLELTRSSGTNQDAQQNLTLSLGNLYNVDGWVKSGTSGNEAGDFGAWDLGGSVLSQAFTSSDVWTFYDGEFTCGNASMSVGVNKASETPGTMLFDQVRLVDITEGVLDFRFTAPPVIAPVDPNAIKITLSLEVLP